MVYATKLIFSSQFSSYGYALTNRSPRTLYTVWYTACLGADCPASRAAPPVPHVTARLGGGEVALGTQQLAEAAHGEERVLMTITPPSRRRRIMA